MLKRKLLMTVLPLLTAGVLVGSGFSSWSFSESNTKATNTLGVTITDMTSNNYSITLNYSNLTLVLDQGGSSNKDDVTKGIYFATTNDTNTAVTTLTASKNGTATDGTNFDSVKFSITIAEAYRPYLKIANDATGRTSDYEATTTVSLSSNVAELTLGTDKTENNFIDYQAAGSGTTGKPTSSTAYTTWKNAIESIADKNAVTITAELVNA